MPCAPGTPLPDKTAAITFDDGYISIYDTAWPLLKAKGWPVHGLRQYATARPGPPAVHVPGSNFASSRPAARPSPTTGSATRTCSNANQARMKPAGRPGSRQKSATLKIESPNRPATG